MYYLLHLVNFFFSRFWRIFILPPCDFDTSRPSGTTRDDRVFCRASQPEANYSKPAFILQALFFK
jgi:hypothetical protein